MELTAPKHYQKPDAMCNLRADAKGSEMVLEMYGPIGPSVFENGISAKDVADALKGPEQSIVCRINSPGGSFFEGLTIYNLLKSSSKPVRVVVDGLAASAASIIAMAGDTIEMSAGTMMMVHAVRVGTYGSAKDLRALADLCEKTTTDVANVYAERTGVSVEDVLTMLEAETWMNSEEAVAKGFANKAKNKDRSKNLAAVAKSYNLAALYEHTPDDLKVFEEAENKGTPVADAARRKLQLY